MQKHLRVMSYLSAIAIQPVLNRADNKMIKPVKGCIVQCDFDVLLYERSKFNLLKLSIFKFISFRHFSRVQIYLVKYNVIYKNGISLAAIAGK